MLLFLVITNLVTRVLLPAGLCFDVGIAGATFDTRDARPVYGLKVDVLDSRDQVIGGGWVQECYVPPMTETVPALLPPEAVAVRVELFGPDLPGKWSDAYFAVEIVAPKLSIARAGTNAAVTWADYSHCWRLQSSADSIHWQDSSAILPATNNLALFRLIRNQP